MCVCYFPCQQYDIYTHTHAHARAHTHTHTRTPLVCRLVMNNEPCWSCQRSQQQFVKSCQAPSCLPSLTSPLPHSFFPFPPSLSLCHLRLHFDAATRCALFHSFSFRFILWFNGLTNTRQEEFTPLPLSTRTVRPSRCSWQASHIERRLSQIQFTVIIIKT